MLKQIQDAYVTRKNENDQQHKTIRDMIAKRQAQIARLEKKESRLWGTGPHWTDELIRPVLAEISNVIPNIHFDDEKLNTFGLGCNCPIGVYDMPIADLPDRFSDEYYSHLVAYITFQPGDLDKGELLFKNGEKNERQFAAGSMGELNGFNDKTVPVESIEQLVEFIQKQMTDNQ